MTDVSNTSLKKTPLHGLHTKLGGRMVEFGGYDMPIQYPKASWRSITGRVRTRACLMSSHMGPSFLALPRLAAAG